MIKSEIKVDNRRNRQNSGLITLDTIDGKLTHSYGSMFRKCGDVGPTGERIQSRTQKPTMGAQAPFLLIDLQIFYWVALYVTLSFAITHIRWGMVYINLYITRNITSEP